jgi:FKBP-type peptidyl-prolyl cis-trans isomerase
MNTFKILSLICLVSFAFALSTKDKEIVDVFEPLHIKEGDNTNFPPQGSKVSVHYTGSFKDGNKFDSSVDRGTQFNFKLGAGQVIKCWDLVVASMSKGEKVKVKCPSKLAYGERGAGRVIPPDTDIYFEIELFSWE